jgi:hypothetical protein
MRLHCASPLFFSRSRSNSSSAGSTSSFSRASEEKYQRYLKGLQQRRGKAPASSGWFAAASGIVLPAASQQQQQLAAAAAPVPAPACTSAPSVLGRPLDDVEDDALGCAKKPARPNHWTMSNGTQVDYRKELGSYFCSELWRR